MTMPLKSKYKALHGSVQSFSDGITGLLCAGFHELARLLAPEGVTVTFYGEHLAGSTVTEIRK